MLMFLYISQTLPHLQFTEKVNNWNSERLYLVVSGRLLVFSNHLLVVCGRLQVVCSHLLVLYGCSLLVFCCLLAVCAVCGWFLLVCWWFVVVCWFVIICARLWWFVVVACFSNYGWYHKRLSQLISRWKRFRKIFYRLWVCYRDSGKDWRMFETSLLELWKYL